MLAVSQHEKSIDRLYSFLKDVPISKLSSLHYLILRREREQTLAGEFDAIPSRAMWFADGHGLFIDRGFLGK